MRNRKRTGWHRIINGVNISAFFVVLFVGLPLYWLIASSFKTPQALGDSPPQYFPNPVSTQNYHDAFVTYDFGIYFRNSLIVTTATVVLSVVSATLAGYSFAKLRWRLSGSLYLFVLAWIAVPPLLLMVPIYVEMVTPLMIRCQPFRLRLRISSPPFRPGP